MKKKCLHFFSFSFLILFFSGVFFSCSQTTPELLEADYSVIFEYADLESFPKSRLSFFMESETEVARYDRIKITAIENGYIWDTKDFSKIILDNTEWAGKTNFVVPDNEIIPTGKYEVTYYNADEKETTVYVTVNYDTSIYDLKAEQLESKMEKDGCMHKIAIYDVDDILIYYGEKTQDYNTVRDVWNMFRNAAYFYDIWCTNDEYVICIMPKQMVALD